MNAVTRYGEPPAHVTGPDEERPLPQNLDAEQALLGAILSSNAVYERVSDLLKPEHFFDALHGRIYAALGKMIAGGTRADPIRLKNLFDQDPALAEHGGSKYLAQLATAVVTVINAEDYGTTIIDLAKRRRLIALARQAEAEAFIFDADLPIDAYLAKVEAGIGEIVSDGGTGEEAVRLDVLVGKVIDRANEARESGGVITGITTGLAQVDKLTGGLHETDLIILAGRPSMGKSALAQGFARAAAIAGNPTAFFSMEMGAEQIAGREVAGETGIGVDKLRRGDFGMFDLQAMRDFQKAVAGLPVYVDATAALTVPLLRAKARYLKRRYGIKLIIVDYLQLMRGTSRGQNRTEELSEITRGLKAIAKELNIPVVALSQLSRQVEARDDKRPQLSDLRESGSIEQDADVVMFVYRDEYYEERKQPREGSMAADKFLSLFNDWSARMDKVRGKAEVAVAKQRHGPIDTAVVKFDGPRTKFSDLHSGAEA